MLCNKCKMTDMKVERIKDDKMCFKCRCCGNEEEMNIEDVEQRNKKV